MINNVNNNNNNNINHPSTLSSHFLDERTNNTLSDEATARRIQQELHDADYAQRLSALEQQEVMAQQMQQQQQQQQQEPASRPSCMRRLSPILVCIVILVGLVSVLVGTGVFDPSDVPILDDIFGDDWLNGDPWSGNTTGLDGPTPGSDAYAWANSGNGLTLDILNACSDDWQVFVTEALTNWDNGYPIDSLTFQTTRIDYESECSDVRGKLKICNGDYGDTRWRGLNEVMLSQLQNVIISSTARLNEYYLARESDAQRLYTVCHELGHGFGLPHWDENFFNQDLGNCMDYTQNPSQNSKPDTSNFLYLAQLYGGRNVTEATTTATTAEATTTTEEDSSAIEAAVPPSDSNNNDRRRHRRHRQLLHRQQQQQQELPSSRLLDVIPYHSSRQVLQVNDHEEVHLILKDDGTFLLQQYLMAELLSVP
jgi:hypothetical protein